MAGQVALITGAGGGIGRALAVALARRGARVALLDVDAAGLAGTLAALPQHEGTGVSYLCDVRDPARWQVVMREVTAHFGGVDILVNNAGISHHSAAEATQLAVLQRVMDINFYGAVHGTLAALPSLRARHGVIVVMSSVAGFAPLLGRSAYAASKHALHGWFDTLRSELVGSGVSVMLVCPSFVKTDIDRHALAGDGGPIRHVKATVGQPVAPEALAETICAGILARRRQLVPSTVAWSAWWVSRLAPALYERIMRRRVTPQ